MSNFGELLREARIRAGLTQEELAQEVDVSDGYICKLETGDSTSPSRKVAVKLADALGISDPEERIKFLSAAGVLHDEDWHGFDLVKVAQPAQTAVLPATQIYSPSS